VARTQGATTTFYRTCHRTLATDAPAAAATPLPPATTKSSGGAGFFQRVGSFLIGAGLCALGTQFYILDEIRQGNRLMIRKQQELEERLHAMETKKK
jgi:hypothetical protein